MTKSKLSTRYVIGIDLGTTNCALAYGEPARPDLGIRSLAIPQWDQEGAILRADTLPSFMVLPSKASWRKGQLNLPWQAAPAEAHPVDFAVGRWARQKSSLWPGRVIHSAKSWLCHGGVSRRERILPWHSDEVIGSERRSPVEVSAAYLEHLRQAWDFEMAQADPEARFEAQEVVITVPASFDEVAQRLTLEAAEAAGYPRDRVRLLEEPQAAFYEWMSREGGEWFRSLGERGAEHGIDQILVCDIGGGTTDFTLIRVKGPTTEGPLASGQPVLERIGVSEHLLLGGDNIDLRLAQLLESQMEAEGAPLTPRERAALVFEARQLKEKALSTLEQESGESGDSGESGTAGGSQDQYFVSIAGQGSQLFAGARTASMTRELMVREIVNGFFPLVSAAERPRRQRGGLSQLGLPYAQDPAITRHLAAFLEGRRVGLVLFTGGTLKPVFLRERILDQLALWQGERPLGLTTSSMDLAVSRGAAYYGLLRQGAATSQLMRSGYPRSLYVEVAAGDGRQRLVCVLPQGYVPGDTALLTSTPLRAMIGRPVRFKLYASTRRPADQLGDVLEAADPSLVRLPHLDTVLDLKGGEPRSPRHPLMVAVALEMSLQETGALDIACVATETDLAGHRWRLAFNLEADRQGTQGSSDRGGEMGHEGATSPTSSTGSSPAGISWPPDRVALVHQKLGALFGKRRSGQGVVKGAAGTEEHPKHLVRDLEEIMGTARDQWDLGFLRGLWPDLEPGVTRRNRSLEHELAWLYLAGYALRPGYGSALDPWRMAELWRAHDIGLAFPRERAAEDQWWILWRRVAGGLSRVQQEQVFDRIFPVFRKGETPSAEIYMLAGSLERLDMGLKVKIGQSLVQQIISGRSKHHHDQRIWALGRVASRALLYAGPESIVHPTYVEEWVRQLMALDPKLPAHRRLPVFYLQAARLVDDRDLDLSPLVRSQILSHLEGLGVGQDLLQTLVESRRLSVAEEAQLFGESLPLGLWLEP